MGEDAAAATARPARSSVLRLRGLPFQATETDIEEFFVGFELKQCQIGKRNGRSTGEAYVQLDTEMAAGKALQELNCKHMGRRYIEIFEASESDLSPGGEGKGVLGYVLRLRGLPYSATRSDVEKFFETIQIYKGEEGVVFSVTSSGRPTGEAYVEFMSEEAQQDAMKRHKQHMGSRYIELFKSTKADLLQALQQNRYYKEQAERRQWLAQNMPAIPADSSGLRSPYSPMGGVEDVTKVLQSLSVGPQSYQAPPGVQPGQQMVPHEMMMMQQHYLMQQHMMQQQQQLGWDVAAVPHSTMPHMASGQAPYPSGYAPLSAPGVPMGRGGPLPYMYPVPAHTTSLPSSMHPPGADLGERNDSGLDISAGGGSPPVDGNEIGDL